MKTENLGATHIAALTHFASGRALTATGLARVMQLEKAPAKSAIEQLLSRDFIKSYSPWEYAISEGGRKFLESKGIPFTRPVTKPAKPKKKPATIESATKNLVASESEALKEIMKDTPVSKVLVVPPEQAEAVTKQVWAGKPYLGIAKELEGVKFVSARPAELSTAPLADFDTLVRQGLTWLNKQMGMQPVTIDRLDLKIETLQSLATMIKKVDQPVADVLLSIALDLQRMPK